MMLEVSDLDFDYPDNNLDYQKKSLLKSVNFALARGELLHLRGGNGCGKTSLLKLIAGLLQPLNGDIRYCGQSIANYMSIYQQHLCFVGHKLGISSLLTVEENCQFDLQCDKYRQSFDEILKLHGLYLLRHTPCGLLSAGQKRRVSLLRLMISNSSLWILDEPLIALDNDAVIFLMRSIAEHLEKGGQVIVTSHQQLPLTIGDYQEYFL